MGASGGSAKSESNASLSSSVSDLPVQRPPNPCRLNHEYPLVSMTHNPPVILTAYFNKPQTCQCGRRSTCGEVVGSAFGYMGVGGAGSARVSSWRRPVLVVASGHSARLDYCAHLLLRL